MNPRIGFGHDIHRVAPGRPLRLGGVAVPADFGLLGHSDADVVLHALCDALLGAAGAGDIGELFPDSDARWKDADSRVFVAEALRRVALGGWRIMNVDLTILAERPKLGPRKAEIRAAIAAMLGLPPEAVNVKAGTNEGLDAVGRGEAIECYAVALLEAQDD